MVGDFARAHQYLVAEEVDVLHEVGHGVVGECECAGGGELTFALFHEVHHGVLDNLGVHFEDWYFGVFAQAVEHGVGHVADTALDGEELFGEFAFLEFFCQEV